MNSLLQIFKKDFTQKTKDCDQESSLDFHFGDIVNDQVKEFEHEIKKIVRKSKMRGEGTIVLTEGTKTTLLTFLFFPRDCELKIDHL